MEEVLKMFFFPDSIIFVEYTYWSFTKFIIVKLSPKKSGPQQVPPSKKAQQVAPVYWNYM